MFHSLLANFSRVIFERMSIQFDDHVAVYRDKFIIIKPNRCTNFSNLFRKGSRHVSDSSSVHHQELSTVNTAMVRVIQFLYADCEPSANLYDMYHCCIYSEKTPDD